MPTPILRGTGIRVETVVVAHQRWGQTAVEIAEQYEIPIETVEAALAYYPSHPAEIDTLIRAEQEIEAQRGDANQQTDICSLRGQAQWDGDLDAQRQTRLPEP